MEDEPKIKVGTRRSFTKTVTSTEVQQFAEATGDYNAIHMVDEYAEQTRFEERIAHGMLTAGIAGAAIGWLYGGCAVWVEQHLNFEAPVHLYDRVDAEAVVTEQTGDRTFEIEVEVTRVADRGERIEDPDERPVVLSGTGTIFAGSVPDTPPSAGQSHGDN